MSSAIYLASIPAAGLLAWLYWRFVENGAAAAVLPFRIENITDSLPTKPGAKYHRRTLGYIDKIIVHHSATSSGTPESFANYHINQNGWPGIGYHFVIDKEGTVYQTNDLETVSYHCSGQNASSVGVCLIGNFDIETLTAGQQKNLDRLVQNLRGKLPRPIKVFGHRDFKNTNCPGANLPVWEFE